LVALFVDDTVRSPGAAVEMAAIRKCVKYANLVRAHVFHPLAFENFGTMKESCFDFICDLGNTISSVVGDCLEARFLSQRISITIRHFSAVLLKDTF
jgi:hypothetical protein